ncbi:hypothetical protein KCU88_g98, partial [Aureobasidium melanogenum]
MRFYAVCSLLWKSLLLLTGTEECSREACCIGDGYGVEKEIWQAASGEHWRDLDQTERVPALHILIGMVLKQKALVPAGLGTYKFLVRRALNNQVLEYNVRSSVVSQRCTVGCTTKPLAACDRRDGGVLSVLVFTRQPRRSSKFALDAHAEILVPLWPLETVFLFAHMPAFTPQLFDPLLHPGPGANGRLFIRYTGYSSFISPPVATTTAVRSTACRSRNSRIWKRPETGKAGLGQRLGGSALGLHLVDTGNLTVEEGNEVAQLHPKICQAGVVARQVGRGEIRFEMGVDWVWRLEVRGKPPSYRAIRVWTAVFLIPASDLWLNGRGGSGRPSGSVRRACLGVRLNKGDGTSSLASSCQIFRFLGGRMLNTVPGVWASNNALGRVDTVDRTRLQFEILSGKLEESLFVVRIVVSNQSDRLMRYRIVEPEKLPRIYNSSVTPERPYFRCLQFLAQRNALFVSTVADEIRASRPYTCLTCAGVCGMMVIVCIGYDGRCIDCLDLGRLRDTDLARSQNRGLFRGTRLCVDRSPEDARCNRHWIHDNLLNAIPLVPYIMVNISCILHHYWPCYAQN